MVHHTVYASGARQMSRDLWDLSVHVDTGSGAEWQLGAGGETGLNGFVGPEGRTWIGFYLLPLDPPV